MQVLCRIQCTAPEPEKRRLNLPLGILLRKLPNSCSSGGGRFALGGGFRPVDGPGFDECLSGDDAICGEPSGREVSCVGADMSSSGGGRFVLGGGFRSVDGPGFDDEAGGGWLSVGPGVGG